MARKTRRRKAGRTISGLGAKLAALRDVNWSAGRRYAIAAAWLLGLVAILTGWIIGVPRLRQAVAEAARAEQTTVEFADLPTWVNGDLLAMLVMTAQVQLGGDPLDQRDLVLVHDALLNTGWFDSIDQVRRVRADLVRIHATFVRPFAVIRDDEGDHLVDPRGRLLPRSYAQGEASRFIVITGAHFDRPQRPGAQWDGADVTAALRLTRLLDSKPWLGQVSSIDAADYFSREDGGGLIITTDRGSRIIWGSAPGEEQAGEATAERKLSYLDYQAEHQGHIDGGYTGELDITSSTGVFAR
jgi:hypothetical protein